MIAICFGLGEFCYRPCGQAHIDIFNKDAECSLQSTGGMKLTSADDHTKNEVVFLLKHFNKWLVDDNGCLICTAESGNRTNGLPDKSAKLNDQVTITTEFGKLQTHCKNHSMLSDVYAGLARLHFPKKLDNTIQLSIK